MPTYLLSYRMPAGYVSTPETRASWTEFFGTVSTQLEDIGAPIFTRDAVGETGPQTVLGGYTMIDAASLEQAAALAGRCPLMRHGGGVEVGELTPPTG
ncbi:MAG TPA: YciI family protein [Solirubrobacteraceae bacterium]|nr:YciI family protein [Solirubrobacteraceae bacterium]